MVAFDPRAYGPVVAALLASAPLNDLGPGAPNQVARRQLEALTDEGLFPEGTQPDRDLAACCRAALWLRHDFLDQSHAISQEVASPEGSFWIA